MLNTRITVEYAILVDELMEQEEEQARQGA